MPRKDDPETLENLISLVRENPVIYNPVNPSYRDTDIWEFLRDAMGIAGMTVCRIMRHLVIKLELLAPGEVFCISRHLARSLVKHSELLIKIQNVNIVRQKFLFENGPSKQIMNIFGSRAYL